MIVDSENRRRYGISGINALLIVVACTAFVLALLTLLPDS